VMKSASSNTPGLAACVWCKGTGTDDGTECPACSGQGNVSVKQPATKCRRCDGTGVEVDRITYTSPRCIDCSGTGWRGGNL